MTNDLLPRLHTACANTRALPFHAHRLTCPIRNRPRLLLRLEETTTAIRLPSLPLVGLLLWLLAQLCQVLTQSHHLVVTNAALNDQETRLADFVYGHAYFRDGYLMGAKGAGVITANRC